MNKLIAPAKKALAQKYGYKNVRVRNGQGTAWGWVEAKVSVPTPKKECGREHTPWETCYTCSKYWQDITKEAKEIMWKAWQALGLKPYTYSSDDGYGSERSEVLVDVEYI